MEQLRQELERRQQQREHEWVPDEEPRSEAAPVDPDPAPTPVAGDPFDDSAPAATQLASATSDTDTDASAGGGHLDAGSPVASDAFGNGSWLNADSQYPSDGDFGGGTSASV
ncbi:MAG TPA: hypothetical protein VKG45_04490 [Actinomycetes bacterium]|nr:hypothetical protein [Actinomycetes bacterium]